MNSERVTIVRAGKVDRYGDPIDDGVRIDIDGVVIAPRGSVESQNYSNTVLTDYTAFWPPGAELPRATDVVEWRGELYSVEGTPAVWSSPFSDWTPGAQVALKTREG